MGEAFEVKFTLLEQIDETIADVIAGYESYVGVDTIFLKSRLLEREDVLVIDFEVSDTRRCLSYGASIQSSPKYDNLLATKLKLLIESVIEKSLGLAGGSIG
jgi:hypothetical protein